MATLGINNIQIPISKELSNLINLNREVATPLSNKQIRLNNTIGFVEQEGDIGRVLMENGSDFILFGTTYFNQPYFIQQQDYSEIAIEGSPEEVIVTENAQPRS